MDITNGPTQKHEIGNKLPLNGYYKSAYTKIWNLKNSYKTLICDLASMKWKLQKFTARQELSSSGKEMSTKCLTVMKLFEEIWERITVFNQCGQKVKSRPYKHVQRDNHSYQHVQRDRRSYKHVHMDNH